MIKTYFIFIELLIIVVYLVKVKEENSSFCFLMKTLADSKDKKKRKDLNNLHTPITSRFLCVVE